MPAAGPRAGDVRARRRDDALRQGVSTTSF